jgi:hypothetical protein
MEKMSANVGRLIGGVNRKGDGESTAAPPSKRRRHAIGNSGPAPRLDRAPIHRIHGLIRRAFDFSVSGAEAHSIDESGAAAS